ncbi:MAG: CHAT domain-containing protein [Anaerolineae bacterium]
MTARLRLKQMAQGQDDYRITVQYEQADHGPLEHGVTVHFKLEEQDATDLRWYFEDYLQHPQDPAPKIAQRIQARMAEIGGELFKTIFIKGQDTGEIWTAARDRLNETRVEIVTDVREATTIPWELLRDPRSQATLALTAQSFVRAQPSSVKAPTIPAPTSDPLRILLVICRPSGGDDVPFRSVATRLLKGLNEDARKAFQLDVLRPPIFAQLEHVLTAAHAQGKPYHIVHFDGHGVYQDFGELALPFNHAQFYGDNRTGKHGYLAFENPGVKDNLELVDGPRLGRLLVQTGIPILVLNACRSAHSEPEPTPAPSESGEQNVHAQVRAFGSLAQEVMDAGVAGVVAMRYNVYVVTAAQFVADLYGALVRGQTLGEAVTLGRKQLAANPLRSIAYDPVELQDWPVPVVYEAAPVALARPQPATAAFQITLDTKPRELQGVPPPPDVGFFGRDETLLGLDRAFDTQHIVLLHAYAGSGKTATAAEFARWYVETGGLQGPVLFTSFEQYKPLSQGLDTLGRVFESLLEQNRINWLALTVQDQRGIALQILQAIPILWVWDNVEPVAGFPAGTPSAWSAAEQKELADFLRDAARTQAKFLLTSRRDERGWLGDLPTRITLPPMPMQEQFQLVRAIAEKNNRRITAVKDWTPLLRFSQGNPLTLTVLAGQALRQGLSEWAEVEDFVARLRAGQSAFDDEPAQGRSRSLGASLAYGFETAFTGDERKILALLHFFQGFVNVDALRWMGDPDIGNLPEVRGLTRETGIALLDRATEIGLLTAHGNGYYTIHPALPWFFQSLFNQYYPPLPLAAGEGQGVGAFAATRAFASALGTLGNHYHRQYNEGHRDVIVALNTEEANLLHARRLARQNEWWGTVINTMQGLDEFYDHTGRRAEWAQLVNEIVPDFVDPATGGPLPGREEEWGLVTEYRVRLARGTRRWAEAERLQRGRVDWSRQRAATALAKPAGSLDGAERNSVLSLGSSLHELGGIQRERNLPECIESYKEALALAQKIQDDLHEAIAAFNLGTAYENIPSIRDLTQAEQWYRRSLELCDEGDHLGQSKCLGQLGSVAQERFEEAREAKKPAMEVLGHLNEALRYYLQALELSPQDMVNDRAAFHNQLGLIYDDAGDRDRALFHWREGIQYAEGASNWYEAGKYRFNIALTLANAGRLADARAYAYAALRNYETFGDRAAEEIERTRGLIARIEGKRK